MSGDTSWVDRNVLKRLRKSQGLSQKRLAKRCGVSERTIVNAENNKPIRFDTVHRLCEFFDVPQSTLLIKKIDDEVNEKKRVYLTQEVKIKLNQFGKDSDPDEVFEFLRRVLSEYDIDLVEIVSAKPGSVHFELRMTSRDEQKLTKQFRTNAEQELVLDEGMLDVCNREGKVGKSRFVGLHLPKWIANSIKRAWTILTIDCQGSAELVSQSFDRKLHWSENLAVWVHCRLCSKSRKLNTQLKAMNQKLDAVLGDPNWEPQNSSQLVEESRHHLKKIIENCKSS